MRLVWAVLALVQLSYCIWHVLAKRALMSGTHPLVLAFYREILAVSCMHALAWRLDGRNPWNGFYRSDLKFYLILGVFSFGNIVGFIVALFYITSFNSALLHPSIPVFAAVIGSILGVERMTSAKGAGIGLCALGAVVTVVWGVTADTTEGSDPDKVVFGNVILLLQCASMAALLVLSKKELSRGAPPTTLTARYYTFASLLTLLTAMCAVPPWSSEHNYGIASSNEAVVAVLYGGVVSVTFVYCAFSWATKNSNPTTSALSMTLQPPFNAVLSVIFMGRTYFSAGEIVGGIFVVAGLILTVKAQMTQMDGMPLASNVRDSPLANRDNTRHFKARMNDSEDFEECSFDDSETELVQSPVRGDDSDDPSPPRYPHKPTAGLIEGKSGAGVSAES